MSTRPTTTVTPDFDPGSRDDVRVPTVSLGSLDPGAEAGMTAAGKAGDPTAAETAGARPMPVSGPGRPARATTPERLAAWLGEAQSGAACVYYRGHLQVARSPRNVLRHERQRAVALGKVACDAERRGLVHLVQRRHGPDDYTYIMIRTTFGAPG